MFSYWTQLKAIFAMVRKETERIAQKETGKMVPKETKNSTKKRQEKIAQKVTGKNSTKRDRKKWRKRELPFESIHNHSGVRTMLE